jgi:cell wall-associated NlpC family hydrolase
MGIREQIVAEAKTWLGTPYHDFAFMKGAGVDCAFFPLKVYQAVGLIGDFTPPWYSPQQWLNSPEQTDKMKLRFEDTTFLDVVLKFAHREITEAEVKPGDFIIVKIAASWTHGGIVVSYPEYILHPIKGRGVIGSHRNEGFWAKRPMRFFTVVKDE